MPTKIGGGHQMQEYDPETGRYGCSSGGFTKSYKIAQRHLAGFKTMKEEKRTSKIMPNYKKAITADEKFVRYSLDPNSQRGKDKALVYKEVLGFTQKNYLDLKSQIHNIIVAGKAHLTSMKTNDHDVIEYNYQIPIKGANGNTATVVVKYGIAKNKANPWLITNYIKKEKRSK